MHGRENRHALKLALQAWEAIFGGPCHPGLRPGLSEIGPSGLNRKHTRDQTTKRGPETTRAQTHTRLEIGPSGLKTIFGVPPTQGCALGYQKSALQASIANARETKQQNEARSPHQGPNPHSH